MKSTGVWKQNFSEIFTDYLKQQYNPQGLTTNQVFETYQNLNEGARRGIWVSIGKILGIKSKEVHDFFHNTWVKQFYDDISLYRCDLVETVYNMIKAGGKKISEAVNCTISQFQKIHPELKVHLQSTYSFVYTQVKRRNDKEENQPQLIPRQNNQSVPEIKPPEIKFDINDFLLKLNEISTK
ncbi:Conserved_hypothetical protein [Hexamita inflata]|uniref:Uncharacterized protein n=1 Tax=Hexamita inflata TaxID=28002 RepID=A0AA86TTW3_9EUKA|nr:Conserved hypothetical protein [Hexamita inflata]